MSALSKMTRRDFAWYRMDTHKNLMVINSILMFEGELNFDRLRSTIENRLPNYPRFTQKVETRNGTPWWVQDEQFDINRHFELVDDETPHNRESLQQYLEEIALLPLKPEQPLWHMQVLKNVGTGFAIVFRMHHCITDGSGLVHVLKHLTDDRQDHGTDPSLEWHPKHGQATNCKLCTSASQFMFWTRIGAQLGRLTALLPDKRTAFKRTLGGEKSMVWLPPMELELLRGIARRMGSTINDVWVAAVSCALRTYLQEKGEAVDAGALRGAVTFNMRNKADAFLLGNHFGLVAVELPTNVESPKSRLRAVSSRMSAIKKSHQPHATMFFLTIMGYLPRWMQGIILKIFTLKASVVLTNVEGPDKFRYLAGRKMTDVVSWVPQSGTLGVGFAILSYAGQAQMTVYADTNQVPDPARLMELIHEAMFKLERDTMRPGMAEGVGAGNTELPKGLGELIQVTG